MRSGDDGLLLSATDGQHKTTMFQRLSSCYHAARRAPIMQSKAHMASQHICRCAWDSGNVCAALATVIFSVSGLQVKLTGGRVPVLQLCLIRSSISFFASLAIALSTRIKPLFGHQQHFHLLFCRGFFGTLAFSMAYVSLLTLPLGDSTTIAQMRPPVTSVAAWLLLGEPLGANSIAGCLISVIGVVVLIHPPFLFGGHGDWGDKRLLGIVAGISSTLFSTGTSYAIRKIGKAEPALVVAMSFHTITILLMTPLLLLGIPEPFKAVAPDDCLLLAGIATTSFFGQLLMTRSFQLLPAARAAAMSFMGVVYSHILGAVVFHERLTLTTLGGGVLIFIGVLLVTVHRNSKETNSSKDVDAGGQAYTAMANTDSADSSVTVSVAAPASECVPKADTVAVTAGAPSAAATTEQASLLVAAVANSDSQPLQARGLRQWLAQLRQLSWRARNPGDLDNSSSSSSAAMPITNESIQLGPMQQQHLQHQKGGDGLLDQSPDLDVFALTADGNDGNGGDAVQPLLLQQSNPSWASWPSRSSEQQFRLGSVAVLSDQQDSFAAGNQVQLSDVVH
eukprot:GHRR01005006.1.p1 GENE.GHRR01005006.1~~GHRR01005006.1.p1  ORF type:complete len:564 (+),score=172.35 GHRR01005006.1:243-1934(+)